MNAKWFNGHRQEEPDVKDGENATYIGENSIIESEDPYKIHYKVSDTICANNNTKIVAKSGETRIGVYNGSQAKILPLKNNILHVGSGYIKNNSKISVQLPQKQYNLDFVEIKNHSQFDVHLAENTDNTPHWNIDNTIYELKVSDNSTVNIFNASENGYVRAISVAKDSNLYIRGASKNSYESNGQRMRSNVGDIVVKNGSTAIFDMKGQEGGFGDLHVDETSSITILGSDGDEGVWVGSNYFRRKDPGIGKGKVVFNGGAGEDRLDVQKENTVTMNGGADSDEFEFHLKKSTGGTYTFNGEEGKDTFNGREQVFYNGQYYKGNNNYCTGNCIIRGGKDDDTIITSANATNTLYFAKGDGNDTVTINGGNNTEKEDKIVFEGFAKQDLWFSHKADTDDLLIKSLDGDDSVTLKDWFKTEAAKVDAISLDGRQELSRSAVQKMVQAMAGYNPGTLAVDAKQKKIVPEQVKTALTANWHVPIVT